MQYVRCKCGACYGYSSMGGYDCIGCEKCGTTLSVHPDHCKPIQPHDYIENKMGHYDENGKLKRYCKNCGRWENDLV